MREMTDQKKLRIWTLFTQWGHLSLLAHITIMQFSLSLKSSTDTQHHFLHLLICKNGYCSLLHCFICALNVKNSLRFQKSARCPLVFPPKLNRENLAKS